MSADDRDPAEWREGETPEQYAARAVAWADARHAKPPHPAAADLPVEVRLAIAGVRRTDAKPQTQVRYGARAPLPERK